MLEVSTAPGGPLSLTGAPELRGSPVRDTLCCALLSLLSLTSLAHHCGREEPRDPLSREFWDHIYSQARPVKGAAGIGCHGPLVGTRKSCLLPALPLPRGSSGIVVGLFSFLLAQLPAWLHPVSGSQACCSSQLLWGLG